MAEWKEEKKITKTLILLNEKGVREGGGDEVFLERKKEKKVGGKNEEREEARCPTRTHGRVRVNSTLGV